jgi:Host cell surface-exposed lipoprotein
VTDTPDSGQGQPDPYADWFKQQPGAGGAQAPYGQQQLQYFQPPPQQPYAPGSYAPPTQQFQFEPQPPPRQRNWIVRHPVWSSIIGSFGALVLIIVVAGVATAGKNPPSKPVGNAGAAASVPAASSSSAPAAQPTTPAAQPTTPAVQHTTQAAAPPPAPAQTTQAPPAMTASEASAVQDAQQYLSTVGGFSQSGLIQQLEYDQFSAADATFAVNYINPNWNTEAAQDAQNYMNTVGGFSCGSLLQQLEYDGFTQSQAEYGTNSVGLGTC